MYMVNPSTKNKTVVEHVKAIAEDSVSAQHLQLNLQLWMGIDECGNLIHNRNELLMQLF